MQHPRTFYSLAWSYFLILKGICFDVSLWDVPPCVFLISVYLFPTVLIGWLLQQLCWVESPILKLHYSIAVSQTAL